MLEISLEGKTALVTGAGRGIGRAIALKLASAGAAVALNDLDAGEAEDTAAAVRDAGARVLAAPGDITQPEFPHSFVDACLKEFRTVDIVVNNAGYTWDNVIQKTTDEQFQAMLDIHVAAPFRILRAASGYMREAAKAENAQGRRVMRKVVNITSIAGTEGNPGQAGYSSGKAAVIGLTKTLAKEWGRYNINVNAVGFGLIETRLIQPLTQSGASIQIKGRQIPVGVQPKMLETVKAICPLGRLGTADEAASAVLFFCSPLSDYITGEVLICSGGLHF
jgi:3-oxoacyl-[acyl-carrier protein] reductase